MTRTNITNPEATEIAKRHIRAMLVDGRRLDDVARALGVSRTQIIDVRDGKRGVGPRLEGALAALFYGGSVDRFRSAARGDAFGGGDEAVEGARVVEPEDDRYANRTEALRLLGDQLDPRARATLLSRHLESNADLAVDQWVNEALALHRTARRIDREFAAIEHDDGSVSYEPLTLDAGRDLGRRGTLADVKRNIERKIAKKPKPPDGTRKR